MNVLKGWATGSDGKRRELTSAEIDKILTDGEKAVRVTCKRFYTDYPRPALKYDGLWRKVKPLKYDGDKYVKMVDGEKIKLGHLRHGRPYGPSVSRNYAKRFFP